MSGKTYTGEIIEIKNGGHLYVDNVDYGVIGYQCSMITVSGTFDQSRSKEGILRWH
jgi:hypothetical protein